MNGSTALALLRPTSLWRRLLIALVAVPAILVGLLTMHVLASTDMGVASASTHHSASESVAAAEPVSMIMGAGEAGTPAFTDICGESCGPAHMMLGMMCVLALVITAILLVVHRAFGGSQRLKRASAALLAATPSLAAPSPPSLHVLSISRT